VTTATDPDAQLPIQVAYVDLGAWSVVTGISLLVAPVVASVAQARFGRNAGLPFLAVTPVLFAFAALSLRIELSKSNEGWTLRRTVLGVPWLRLQRPLHDALVEVRPALGSETLYWWTQGLSDPLAIVNSVFHRTAVQPIADRFQKTAEE
jgi:hypothetical protein